MPRQLPTQPQSQAPLLRPRAPPLRPRSPRAFCPARSRDSPPAGLTLSHASGVSPALVECAAIKSLASHPRRPVSPQNKPPLIARRPPTPTWRLPASPAPRLRACCRGSPRKWDPTGGGHRCSRSARCLQGSRCRGRGDALFSTEQCSAVDAPSSVSGPGSSRLRAAVRCCGCRPTAPGSRPGPAQHSLRGPQSELRALRVQELDTPGGVHPNSPLPHSAQAVGVG